jgi:hypothetical protein
LRAERVIGQADNVDLTRFLERMRLAFFLLFSVFSVVQSFAFYVVFFVV